MIITGYIKPIRYEDLRWRALGLPAPAVRTDDPRDWRVQRLTERELLRLVADVVDRLVFLAEEVALFEERPIVFPAAAFLLELPREAVREIGTYYEYRDKAVGTVQRSGQPTFSTVQFVHVDDWARAKDLIAAEMLRRERHRP